MELEQFKRNFLPDSNGKYTPDQAERFAWMNGVDYLRRHFFGFLRRFKNRPGEPKMERLPSVRVRSLFVFYKYYVHGQSPGESDFLDFAQVSYAPYCDVYVTENNACNVLRRIRINGHMLAGTEALTISDFLGEITVQR